MSSSNKEAFNQQQQLINNSQSSCTNGNFQCDNKTKSKTGDVKKPRMIAEVKPMRMSYSDVLSKNVFITENAEKHTINNRNSNSASNLLNGITNINPQQKQTKIDKNKNASNNGEKKSSVNIHDDIKELSNNQKMTKNSTNIGSNVNNTNVKSSTDTDPKLTDNDCKLSKKKLNASAVNNTKYAQRTTAKSLYYMSKRRSQDSNSSNWKPLQDENDKNSSNNGFFYNITKTEVSQSEKPFASYVKSNHRKSSSSKSSTTMNRNGSTRIDKSTVYQQKRSSKSRKNNTYTFLWQLMNTWFNYMLFFLKWLIALVCDVFLLSIGIIWDRVSAAYDYMCQMLFTLRNELANNSGRPYIYFTNLWQRFDNRFHKESKWAFWRRIFSKRKPPEPIPDYYKNGRLPQTGDEAMYSLLNCKGKDAYR